MQLSGQRRVIRAKCVVGAGRSRRPSGVKGCPSCTRGGQAKYKTEDEDGVLTKSSERDVDATNKAARGIGSGRDLSAVKITRRSAHIDIRVLA